MVIITVIYDLGEDTSSSAIRKQKSCGKETRLAQRGKTNAVSLKKIIKTYRFCKSISNIKVLSQGRKS